MTDILKYSQIVPERLPTGTSIEYLKPPQIPDEELDRIDFNIPKTILIFGIGDLMTRLISPGWANGLSAIFPSLRMIAVDIDINNAKARMHKTSLPWISNSCLSPEVVYMALEDSNGNYIEIDGKKLPVDAFMITTPPKTHYEIFHKIQKYNKPIFIEKPLSLDQDVDPMITDIEKNSNMIFSSDLFLDNDAFVWLLNNPDILKKIGRLKTIRASILEEWKISSSRSSLGDMGMGWDIVVHLLTVLDTIRRKADLQSPVVINEVQRRKYKDEFGLSPGRRESYMFIRGQIGDTTVHVDGGKGLDTTYYGMRFAGDRGNIELHFGTEETPPYIFIETVDTKRLIMSKQRDLGYRTTLINFGLMIYHSKYSIGTSRENRLNASVWAVKTLAEIYKKEETYIPEHKLGTWPMKDIPTLRSKSFIISVKSDRKEA